VLPKHLSVERGSHDPAPVDVAVVKVLVGSLAPQAEPMGAVSELLAEGAHESAVGVIDHDRLAPGAGLVHGVGHIDKAV
jgi:hypothetical protein